MTDTPGAVPPPKKTPLGGGRPLETPASGQHPLPSGPPGGGANWKGALSLGTMPRCLSPWSLASSAAALLTRSGCGGLTAAPTIPGRGCRGGGAKCPSLHRLGRERLWGGGLWPPLTYAPSPFKWGLRSPGRAPPGLATARSGDPPPPHLPRGHPHPATHGSGPPAGGHQAHPSWVPWPAIPPCRSAPWVTT